MALGSFTSFNAGTTIVASQMNANFATITTWSSEVARLDGAAFTGACTWTNTITVGSDGTGYDVKFFGDSAGHYMLWDQSADELVLASDSKLSFHDPAGGENIVASADGHLEINAGTTLDITAPTVQTNVTTLDVNGALDVSSTSQFGGAINVGVDGTGHDVKFFGDTASAYMLWDQSIDALVIGGDSHLSYGEIAPTWKVEFATDDDITSLTGTAKGGVCISNNQYDADDYTCLDFSYSGVDTPIGRVALKITGGGSQLEFGTSENYSNGITQKNLVMLPTGINTFSDGEDLTPDSNWSGQIQINGNGFTSGLAADASGLWVGTNSATRDVIFAVDETEKMRVDNAGYLIFKGNSTGAIRNSPSANREILEFRSGGTALTDGAGYNMYGDGDNTHASKHIFFCDSSTSELLIESTGVTISGSLSKGSGSFNIPHPTKGGDWRLRHSFIEGPTADNIYRGTATISGSSVSIDLDAVSGMTDGTWEALNTNPWSMAASSGNAVTWELSGKTLTITGPDEAVCSWMVIGERKDPTIIASDISDSNGKLVVEYEDANYLVTIEEDD